MSTIQAGRSNRGWRPAIAAMSPHALSRYRVPGALRDLVLVDLLELTGSTVATAEALAMSQPSVSRRYRGVASDLGLVRNNKKPVGRRFSDTAWMVQLRRGVNHHRLACGVLRIGSTPDCANSMSRCEWAEWVALGRQQREEWPLLLQLEILDAVAFLETPCPERISGAHELVWFNPADSPAVALVCRRDPMVSALVRTIDW
jgi:hypothetical protein